MDNWQDIVTYVIMTFGAGVCTWVGNHIVAWMKEHTKNKKLQMVEDHAITCVQAIYQRTMKSAKLAYADKKMSDEDFAKVKADALDEAKKQLWIFLKESSN